MLEIGSVVDGKYKILTKVGQGGMSVVYLAINERANKQWAVKEVRKDGVQNFEVVRQGLVAETDMLKKLNHPHLPSIVDVIDDEDTFIIVMDYIEGNSLSKALEEYGAQSQEDVIKWARQLCDVLGYLHSRKPPIIYRDMKPSNVMLKPDGNVMLIDFGTAREFKGTNVEDTVCLGTQGYAAPEQYGGHGETDARTDIYCLGATLYHLITGHNPSQPPYEMYPIRSWNPALSSGLEDIIIKCTQRNPADRYQSCAELMYDLEHYQELEHEFKRSQNRKWAAFLATMSLTVVMGLGSVAFAAAESNVKSSTYDAYLEEAQNLETTDSEESIAYYEHAVDLNPSRPEAYENMLDFFLWRNNSEETAQKGQTTFSSQEEQEIRKVLGSMGDSSNRTNESYLEGNTDAYTRFAYDLGIAYFYSYEGVGNKAAAKKWLQIAVNNGELGGLNNEEIQRAENLNKIAEYYDDLSVRNQAGDSKGSYLTYWDNLTSVVQSEKNSSNTTYKLLAYKELASQISTSCAKFQNEGITKEQMLRELQNAEETIESISNDVDGVTEQEQELIDVITKNLSYAKDKVNSQFNTANLRQSEEGGDTSGTNAADSTAD